MNALICPLCAESLIPNPQGLACSHRHQFDRAKEGYFHLLPVQYKHSKEPGDAKEQLQARRCFLQAGFFDPLLAAMQQALPQEVEALLDIGCGEGYFTAALAKHLAGAYVYGIDIAKTGVRMAARQAVLQGETNSVYAVASSYALPLADQSLDWITRIYAPSKDEELARVLKPGGRVMIVTPADEHLQAIRRQIYKEVRPYQLPHVPAGFVLEAEERVNFAVQIPAGEQSAALLTMTPFAWKMPPTLKQGLIESGFGDQADFRVSIYRKQ